MFLQQTLDARLVEATRELLPKEQLSSGNL